MYTLQTSVWEDTSICTLLLNSHRIFIPFWAKLYRRTDNDDAICLNQESCNIWLMNPKNNCGYNCVVGCRFERLCLEIYSKFYQLTNTESMHKLLYVQS